MELRHKAARRNSSETVSTGRARPCWNLLPPRTPEKTAARPPAPWSRAAARSMPLPSCHTRAPPRSRRYCPSPPSECRGRGWLPPSLPCPLAADEPSSSASVRCPQRRGGEGLLEASVRSCGRRRVLAACRSGRRLAARSSQAVDVAFLESWGCAFADTAGGSCSW